MKTEIAVLIALTVSLGELTTSAAVLPPNAAFGGSFSNLEPGNNNDLMNLGYPATVTATSATPFVDSGGAEDTTDNATITIGTTYRFRLTYDQATRDVTFLHLNAGGGTEDALNDNDVYSELLAVNQAWARNLDSLTGFAFGFYAPSGYSITVTNLTLSGGDTWASGGPNKNLPVFNGGGSGVSDASTNFFGATGLSDGFQLDGFFVFSGPAGNDGTAKMGFEVYAVVPEPATVAFGLAMVGGLGLVELRRRKKA